MLDVHTSRYSLKASQFIHYVIGKDQRTWKHEPLRTQSMNFEWTTFNRLQILKLLFVEIPIFIVITAEVLPSLNAKPLPQHQSSKCLCAACRGHTAMLNYIRVNIIPVETKSSQKGLDLCKWTEIRAFLECEHFRSHEKTQLLLMKSVGSRPLLKVGVDWNDDHIAAARDSTYACT